MTIDMNSYIAEYVKEIDISSKAEAMQHMKIYEMEDILRKNELYANTLAFMILKETKFNILLSRSMKDQKDRDKYIKIIKWFLWNYTTMLIQHKK